MEVVLVRHAIAAERDPAKWPGDGDRPLTEQGEDRMRRAARGLGRIVPEVDVVLSSPLARAWRTAEILHEEIGWPAPEPCPHLEPDRSPGQAVRALVPYRDRARIVLVGHEPNLSEIASHLVTPAGGRGIDIEMKKGGAACLGVDGDPGPGTAWLRWLATPRMLRQLEDG